MIAHGPQSRPKDDIHSSSTTLLSDGGFMVGKEEGRPNSDWNNFVWSMVKTEQGYLQSLDQKRRYNQLTTLPFVSSKLTGQFSCVVLPLPMFHSFCKLCNQMISFVGKIFYCAAQNFHWSDIWIVGLNLHVNVVNQRVGMIIPSEADRRITKKLHSK